MSPAPGRAQSKVERGPVRVAVTLEPAPARVSDDLTVTVTIDHGSEVTIRKQELGVSFEDFLVRGSRDEPPRTDSGREVLQRVYTLEPARAGRLTIPPVRVTFAKAPPGGHGAEEILQTDPVEVEVTSMVADLPTLEMLRRPTGPIAFPASEDTDRWFLLGGVAASVVLALALVVWHGARRRQAVALVNPSLKEEARRGLQRLSEEGRATGDIKRFFAELTDVVRRYLELAMGIPALEQTTAELLDEISQRQSLPAEAMVGLRRLLESADMVKFAAHQPLEEEIEENIKRARSCVESRWREDGP